MLIIAVIVRYGLIMIYLRKNQLTPYFSRVSYNIAIYIGLSYFPFGTGSCLGGLSMNDLSSWWITSDKGRSCFSLNSSNIFLTSSVVLNDMNSDLLCLIVYTMLDKYILLFNIYFIRLCMTLYDYK